MMLAGAPAAPEGGFVHRRPSGRERRATGRAWEGRRALVRWRRTDSRPIARIILNHSGRLMFFHASRLESRL